VEVYKCGVRLSEEIRRVQLLLMERKGDIRRIEFELYIGGWGTAIKIELKRYKI
jgi:hypothetical protein